MPTLLVLGASGTMGQLIARQAVQNNLDVILAGRRAEPLLDLASTFPPNRVRVAMVDVADPATLAPVIDQA